MTEAYIVDAVRTAGGRRGGALASWHPADLGGAVLDALVARSGIDPTGIEDVIVGCVTQAGEQSFQIGRNCVLASGLPETVPAISIDRQCGSSLQALQFAAQAVMSGTQDLVVAAGTESMTRAPIGLAITAAMQAGYGSPKSPRMEERYPGVEFNQFLGAELLTEKYGFTREQLDAFALGSHRRAALATENGAFEAEIVALPVMLADGSASEHHRDEGIRYDATAESIGAVRPLKDGGKITPANTSQICDGASAALIASQVALKRYGLTPVARVHKMIVTAGDPVMMIEEPIRATRLLLERAGMTIDDIDLFEINEAFASVPLAWMRALKADPDKINVHGGAIALGHPLGASGTKLTGTLINALRTRGKRFGLLAICEGGGTANVMIVEAL